MMIISQHRPSWVDSLYSRGCHAINVMENRNWDHREVEWLKNILREMKIEVKWYTTNSLLQWGEECWLGM
eukprot:4391063-Ditylum_brightwellii.AAC.2